MLEGIELFWVLNQSEKSMLEMFCQKREYNKWDILFSQWEEASAMYILKSGLLEVYNYDKILWTIQPWDMVWEMALFSNNKKRTAWVKCLEKSTVIALLSFSIHELWLKHPEILKKIQTMIEERNKKNSTM